MMSVLLLPILLACFQQVDLDKVLDRADAILEEAKGLYEKARNESSVPAFVDAGFKLEEARIKCLVVQELGSAEKQKAAGDRLRAINQLAKLIHDGKVAISGAAVDPASPKPAEPPPAPVSRPAVDVSKRSPVPDAAAQKETEKLVRELYKDDYAKKAPADRKALARKLLEQAGETKDDLTAQWVLYREAQDLALQAGDLGAALEAIEAAAKFFDVDSMALRASALAAAAKTARAPEECSALAFALDRLIDDFIAADQYDAAEKAATQASAQARKSGEAALVAKLTARTKEVLEVKALYQAMKGVLEIVAKNPGDPGANLEIGRFLCFVKGNWDLGLRFLTKSSDATLKSLAEKELASPAAAVELSAIADGWSDLAEKEKSPLRKGKLMAHARTLYENALPGATGLLRMKIEKRLEATAASVPATSNPPVAPGSADPLRLIDVAKDSVLGEWSCDGKTLACTSRTENARIQIPYIPPDEYDVTLVVERKDGVEALGIGLARGSTQWIIAVDGWGGSKTGISSVDGKWGADNETTYRGLVLTNGRASTIVVTVRKTGVTMTVDKKKIIDYKGGSDRLSNLGTLTMPSPKTLFLVSYDARYSVTKYVLTPVTGQGKPLR